MSDSNAITTEIPSVSDPRVYLALPAYGGNMQAGFVNSLLRLQSEIKIVGQVDVIGGDSLVNRARNNLAHRFLKGTAGQDGNGNAVKILFDWLLFIDTDIIFDPAEIQMLYDLAVKGGVGIYAGTYALKQLRPKVVFNPMAGQRPDAEGVCEVREAGTGCMLIHRGVFEKMIEVFGDEMRFEADSGDVTAAREVKYDFFTVGVRMDPVVGWKRFLSEDWYFCQRWRETGGKILMHTGVQCQHIGTFVYPPNPKEMIEVGEIYRRAFEDKAAKIAAEQMADKSGYEMPEAVAV